MSNKKNKAQRRAQRRANVQSGCELFSKEELPKQSALLMEELKKGIAEQEAELPLEPENLRMACRMDDPILVLLTASVSFRHPAFVTETSAGVELDLHEVAGNRDEVIRFLKESCESARGQFLVPQLLEGMPGNPEAWSRPDFNLQMAGISGVRNGVLPGLKEVRAARRAFVRKLLDAGNEALAKKREGTAPPFPSAVPVTLSGASVSVSLNQGATQQVELTIRGSIAGSKHSDKAERTAKFHLAGSGSLPEILALLDQQTEALAMDALRELLLTTPAWVLEAEETDPQATVARNILQTGEVRYGPLAFQIRESFATGKRPPQMASDDGASWFLTGFPFHSAARSGKLLWAGENGMEKALAVFQEAADQYGKLEHRPPLTFSFPKGLTLCHWRRQTLPFPAGAAFDVIFQEIQRRERQVQDEPRQRLEILSNLNGGQLKLLRHIVKEGRTWQTDANRVPPDEYCTKAAMAGYLEALEKVRIPVEGRQSELLSSEEASSDYGTFWLYRPNGVLTEEFVAQVQPRGYRPEEMDQLSPAGRERWLLEHAAAADTAEKRTEVLTALSQHLSKTTAASFLKSQEGARFLTGFPPEEIQAAKAVVNAIPGCKTLKIPPEGASLPAFAPKKTVHRATAKEYLADFSLDHLIEAGRQLKRTFIVHVGGTNSGKTYESLRALRKARTGVYLGPLRLLALEVFDTLNEDGYPCSLLTGEERKDIPGAGLTASTIEMADYGTWYDVAVIDECQMLREKERGGFWLQAILTLPAAEIHLCTAPEALPVLEKLLAALEAPYEVARHERLAPLEFAGTMKNLQQVEAGDALIAFSRKGVLSIAAELERLGFAASVIYGALPPQSRREEVRRFKDKETTVVVATDAIGMGISLPIRRVIFCQTSKYDGEQVRTLKTHEIQQIAGRAGRYGIYDKGYVLTMSDPGLIRNALQKAPDPIRKVMLPFPQEALNASYPLKQMLKAWNELPDTEFCRRSDMQNARQLLHHLTACMPKHLMPKDRKVLYSWVCCPVDAENGELVEYWSDCCLQIAQNRDIPGAGDYPERDLAECELKYRVLDIQHQMGRRCGEEIDNSGAKKVVADKINAYLRQSKEGFLRRCSHCGKILPPSTTYGMCDDCYRLNRRWSRNWYDDEFPY